MTNDNYEPDVTIEDVPLPPSRRRAATESDRRTQPIERQSMAALVYGEDDTAPFSPIDLERVDLEKQIHAALAMTVSDGAAPMRRKRTTSERFVRTASGRWCILRGAAVLAILVIALLGACTDDVNEPTGGTLEADPVSCQVQVLQTLNGVSTCAVTVTVEVACTEPADVTSATLTATTNPVLETGLMSGAVAIACGQTQRVTFQGMPCAESASGLVVLNDGTTCGVYTR